MKITYAIAVCNESRDLYSLLSFLLKVKDDEDNINVLVDTLHVTENVRHVLTHYGNKITVCERPFDGDFAVHRNFHLSACDGDYIFMIDPDEMPQEKLILHIKSIIVDKLHPELIAVPRINITLGATRKWYEDHDFGDKINELGWVNWPDYQGRIIKNVPGVIKFGNRLHEKIEGCTKVLHLNSLPAIALLHVKSVDKDDVRWSKGEYVSPMNDNLYDTLM